MNEAEAWMDKLGAMRPIEIARLFLEENVTGVRGEPLGCPVSNFLSMKTGERFRVGTESYRAFSAEGKIHELPKSVMEFVYRFDTCEYEELEEQE